MHTQQQLVTIHASPLFYDGNAASYQRRRSRNAAIVPTALHASKGRLEAAFSSASAAAFGLEPTSLCERERARVRALATKGFREEGGRNGGTGVGGSQCSSGGEGEGARRKGEKRSLEANFSFHLRQQHGRPLSLRLRSSRLHTKRGGQLLLFSSPP